MGKLVDSASRSPVRRSVEAPQLKAILPPVKEEVETEEKKTAAPKKKTAPWRGLHSRSRPGSVNSPPSNPTNSPMTQVEYRSGKRAYLWDKSVRHGHRCCRPLLCERCSSFPLGEPARTKQISQRQHGVESLTGGTKQGSCPLNDTL